MWRLLIDVLVPQLVEKGGMDKVLNDYLPYFEEHGYHVRVVQAVWYGVEWLVPGIEFHYLCTADASVTFREAAENYADFLRRHEKPDGVIAAGWPVTTVIARAAMEQAGVKRSLLAWPHMTFREGLEKGVGGVECMADADVVFAITREIANAVLQKYPSKKVYVIHNPIDAANIPYFEGRTENKLAFVGRLVDSKNIFLVFEALARTKKEWRLVVAGTGEIEKTKERCRQLGLDDRVTFLGWLEAPWEALRDASWLIVSSDYEGFGLVIVEALASGLPVISTPVGIAPEIIKPGENGYLYPEKSNDGLAQVLDYISDGLLPALDSQICRQSALEFKKEQMLELFLSKLDEIFAKQGVCIRENERNV